MKIPVVQSDQILLDLLVQSLPDSTKTTIRSWIKLGRITINGKVEVKPNAVVSKGAIVEFLPKPRPRSGPIEIIYEDKDIVVIYKPSGITSVATDHDIDDSAHAWVKRRYPGTYVYVIHRLDRETSGLMMFALSERAFQPLKDHLKERQVKRIYAAVVEGALEGSGSWEDYLIEDMTTYTVRIAKGHQKEKAHRAETHWKSVLVGERYSLLECTLETGKKNQIRVQASARGFPIAGDGKYGATFSKKEVFNNRICLHAKELSFQHPVTGKLMIFNCPEPEFFTTMVTYG